MYTLIICEKPSLAKNVAEALNIKTKTNGYYQNDQYLITNAFGHLFRLYDVEQYLGNSDTKAKWTLDNLPFYPENFKYGLMKDDGVIKQFKLIRELCNRDDVNIIANAGDSDREGEIIIRTILNYALKSQKVIKRLWMPDQTPKTILSELASMKDDAEYDALAKEGYARTYVDWLYGINLTRFASIKANALLRVGRVIAPIVRAIYDREQAINNFVERKYYIPYSKELTNNEVIEWPIKKEFNEDQLKECEEYCKELNLHKSHVTNLTSEKKIIPAPKLYSLSKLQGDLGKAYKFKPDEVLNIAQSLYEKGFISYPRTPSQYLATNEKDKIKEIINNFKSLGINLRFKDSSKIFDDSKIESHSALTPTYKIPSKRDLNENEQKVYYAISHRFFSVFANDDFEINRTTMEISLDGTSEVLKINGDVVIKKGWSAFDNYEKKEKNLPNLKVGDEVNIKFAPLEKKTVPPKRYTSESLLNFLKNPFKEEKDSKEDDEEFLSFISGVELGTEATRAGIINHAIESKYIALNDNVYRLLPLGKYYIEALEKLHILMNKEKSVELNKSLKDVYKGSITIDDAINLTKEQIDIVFNNHQDITLDTAPKIFTAEKELCNCPLCGEKIGEYDWGWRCVNSACGYTLSKDNKLFATFNIKLTKKIAKEFFTKGRSTFKDVTSKKTNKTFDVTLVAKPNGKYMNFELEFPNKESNNQ